MFTPSVMLAIVLLIAGLFVLVLELFIPSVGMLLLIASTCIVSSVVVAFMVSQGVGMLFLVLVMALAFVLPGIGIQLWKRSPIGKRMFLQVPEDDDEQPMEGTLTSERDRLKGRLGKSLTTLRPSGTVEIDGRKYDSVTEGLMVGAGQTVKVIEVRANQLVVRQVDEEPSNWSNIGTDFL